VGAGGVGDEVGAVAEVEHFLGGRLGKRGGGARTRL